MNKVGEIRLNTYGSEMRIIEYINSRNILIQFKESYIKGIADKSYWKIPNKLYDALYRYEISVDY